MPVGHYFIQYAFMIFSPRFGSSRSGSKFGTPGERLRKKKWDLDELPKFEKNFYTEHPEVQHMSQVFSVLSRVLSAFALILTRKGLSFQGLEPFQLAILL